MEDFFTFMKKNKINVDEIIRKYVPEKWDDHYVEWILGKPTHAYDANALNKSLAEPMWDFLNRGGKRWRPALFLILVEALGGDVEKVKDFVIIPELIHNGSIMVDDVEDMGEMRRGKPCTHKLFGIDIAINTGNMMYYLPLIPLLRNTGNLDNETLLRIYKIYSQEMINLSAGQAMDIWWHKGKVDVTEDQYLQMCCYKTGTLARMAAKLAVALSNGSKEQEEGVGKIAETFGVAFQIQDDILSATGKEFSNQKGYGDDITEGKRSLMVIHALKNAPEEEKKELNDILDSHTKDIKKIDRAIEILIKNGSVEYSKNKAKELLTKAWEEAGHVIPESKAKAKLKSLVDYLIERTI